MTVDKKKNVEVEANVTYVNDTPVVNGKSKASPAYDGTVTTINVRVDDNTFSAKYQQTGNDYKGIGVDDLKKFYNEHNQSAKETYEYLTNYIKENKENPELVKGTIDHLLGDFSLKYDENKNYGNVGANQEEILNKILNTNEEESLDNFICSTIHEFAMKALQDAGVNAVMISGKMNGAGNHATLLYQVDDNKYVFNNYSQQLTVEANNIKDAIREVYKKSGSLENNGYIALKDGSKMSYQEFALREESVFGKEMDKRDYNSNTPFDSDVSGKSTIKANVEFSSQGNVSAVAEGKIAKSNEHSKSELGVSLSYKNNSETSLFQNSTSVGAKARYKKEIQTSDDTTLYYDTKAISTYTKGNLNDVSYHGDSYENPKEVLYSQIESQMKEAGYGNDKLAEVKQGIDKLNITTLGNYANSVPTYISNFIKGGFGLKKDLVKTDKTMVTNATQASLYGGVVVGTESNGGGISIGGDARVALEDGVQVKNQVGKYTFENTLNAGVVGDLKYTSGEQQGGVMFGTKLNASTSATYNEKNWNIGGKASIYNVTTPSAVERGGNIGFRGGIRTNSGMNIFGQANIGVEKQNLRLGGFNQETENKVRFNTVIGAQINPNTTVTVGYSQTKDKLNSTRNNNMFNIGVRVSM
ncbi:hypothetical protein EGQ24_06375 [bacterium]|nr:hypothetical protein [bacterium]